MIHKIKNFKDLEGLQGVNGEIRQTIKEFVNVFEPVYGEEGKGGYVLFAERGTAINDVKAIFNYDIDTIEFIEKSVNEPYTYTICFLVGTEFGIVLIMHVEDAPEEFKKAYKEYEA